MGGDPGEKTVPRMVKFRASDFLSMLNGKWSSPKFHDEQINEKFGVAFSDGDICGPW
jgi:hypothetical protein